MPEPEPSAAAPPALRLLGPPELAAPGRRLAFSAERPFQLLAYLACKGGWVRRDELADLLYPGRGLEAARSNLRKVLLLARRVEGVGTIEQHGELLRWQPDSDLRRFERACDEGRFAEALALYGGSLLHGMDAGWPDSATDWLAAERSRLEGRWRDAALQRLRELRGEPLAAEALAQELLRHDPLDDEAMQGLLDAQGRLGRQGDAQQALQAYAQRLAAALGLEPSAALQQRGQALRHDAAATPAVEPKGLVGRRLELAQLVERFSDGQARLLTLLGPGGVGKTALARAALARLQPQFAAGAAWVDLEPVDAPERVPSQAAAALGLAIDARQDPWAALAKALADSASAPRLLVLDNAEILAADAGFAPRLNALLDAVPGLRLLVTSRVALNARGEWRLPLDGLPLPDADETDLEALQANDAVRLFVHQALPLAPGFALADEAAELVPLVREVEGLPLAICLLASWRRLMPVREILAELRGSLDLLEPTTPQERSVSAAFERSWRQLSALQQRVLAQLALLPQPVDREMLRAVVQAPLPVLASLVDRSLVRADTRADGAGRFSLHTLIRRLAAPRATEGPELLARHARHMAQRVLARSRDSHTAALAAMDDEIEHLRAAWRWALQAGAADLLQTLAAPLTVNDFERGPLGQLLPTLHQAAALLEARLQREGAAGEAATALASVLTAIGTLQFRLSQLDEAMHSARTVVQLADAGMPDHGLIADALITQYNVHLQRGELAAAEPLVARYQAEARASGDGLREAFGHTLAGMTHAALGRLDQALRSFEAARAVHLEIGDTASLPRLNANMGNLLRRMERPRDAVRVLEEGLHWARRHGVAAAQPSLLTNLAQAHEDLGDAATMLRTAERALSAARQTTEPFALMRALLAHGRALAAHDGELAAALKPVWQALRLAERFRIGWERHECLISAARVAARCGRRAEAATLLRWVLDRPDLPPETRQAGQRAQHELGAAEPAAEPATEPAAVWPADARVDELLGLLGPEPPASAAPAGAVSG